MSQDLCVDVGHCYLHLIEHGTWSKQWCCQCKDYIEGEANG